MGEKNGKFVTGMSRRGENEREETREEIVEGGKKEEKFKENEN